MLRVPRSTSLCDILAISQEKKKGRCEVDFCTFINKSFYKLILSILVNMAILAQSTQIIKFAKTFQYFKKDVRDKVDFCTDKH